MALGSGISSQGNVQLSSGLLKLQCGHLLSIGKEAMHWHSKQ